FRAHFLPPHRRRSGSLPRVPRMKSPSSFKVGRILGKCQLLELIARGGMGSIYVAKHIFLQRMVTVKLLKWTFSDLLERSMEAFERGAQALARLNHPNI